MLGQTVYETQPISPDGTNPGVKSMLSTPKINEGLRSQIDPMGAKLQVDDMKQAGHDGFTNAWAAREHIPQRLTWFNASNQGVLCDCFEVQHPSLVLVLIICPIISLPRETNQYEHDRCSTTSPCVVIVPLGWLMGCASRNSGLDFLDWRQNGDAQHP